MAAGDTNTDMADLTGIVHLFHCKLEMIVCGTFCPALILCVCECVCVCVGNEWDKPTCVHVLGCTAGGKRDQSILCGKVLPPHVSCFI